MVNFDKKYREGVESGKIKKGNVVLFDIAGNVLAQRPRARMDELIPEMRRRISYSLYGPEPSRQRRKPRLAIKRHSAVRRSLHRPLA